MIKGLNDGFSVMAAHRRRNRNLSELTVIILAGWDEHEASPESGAICLLIQIKHAHGMLLQSWTGAGEPTEEKVRKDYKGYANEPPQHMLLLWRLASSRVRVKGSCTRRKTLWHQFMDDTVLMWMILYSHMQIRFCVTAIKAQRHNVHKRSLSFINNRYVMIMLLRCSLRPAGQRGACYHCTTSQWLKW